MNFYHFEENMKLLKKQRLERELFVASGFEDSDAIDELFRLDRQQLRGDAKFYHRMSLYLSDEDGETLPSAADSYFGVMDNLENPALYDALCSLKPEALCVLINHAVYGEQHKVTAEKLGLPYNTVKGIYARTKKKVKEFLENATF